MRDDMVMQIARVIEADAWTALECGNESTAYRSRRTSSMRKAKAILHTMRAPKMDMLNAAVVRTGGGSGMSWSNRSPQGLFETAWQAAIDAALEPTLEQGE